MDVVSFDKSDEYFRLLYDPKGRFVLHRITPEEGSYKLGRVVNLKLGEKGIPCVSSPPSSPPPDPRPETTGSGRAARAGWGGPEAPPRREAALARRTDGRAKFKVTLHDGRTIRYPDPLIKVNDTVLLDIATNKIKDCE